ncbi:MAG TPA: RsmG family class I SAM-dependent methyltransferase [Pyrinomonadaceae bacterium]|nr:RsmG family class I SAM-dependent methyltransferase [Pyrinomonadaceae bacterium]
MPERKRTQAEEFTDALAANAVRYGLRLRDEELARLGDYYDTVAAWNARLHLVAPCAPAEFATRHVLESLTALPLLDEGARVVDVGSGAGLPVVPCLIVRPDLSATLVEASPKKAVFLREALRRVERHTRARVLAERFERLPPPAADALTCRALERFDESLPALARWAAGVRTLLLFGGPALGQRIESRALAHEAVLMPDSEQRFLYVISTEGEKGKRSKGEEGG